MTVSKSNSELLPLGFRFAREFFLISILLMLFDYGIDQYYDREVPVLVLTLLPAIVAALSVSMAFAKKHNRGCTTDESQYLAKLSVLMIAVLSALFFCVSIIFSLVSGRFSAGALVDMMVDFWVIVVFGLVLVLILSVLFLVLQQFYKIVPKWLLRKQIK